MSGEPQVPELQDTPAPPADAGSQEQADYLVATGQMVEVTDAVTGGTFLMPAAAAAVAPPEIPPPVNPIIELTAIAPTTASVASIVNLVATGRFQPSSVIVMGGVALSTTFISGTELRATIPGGTQAAGEIDVVVIDSGTATAPQTFTYTE